MKLDKSQLGFCESTARHLRLLAPAGSGKTLSLLWRCKYLAERDKDNSQRFMIFTFTRVARDELQQRIWNDPDFQDLKGIVRVDTLNRWGYQYLRKQVNSALALKTGSNELFTIVKHNLRPVWSNHSDFNQIFSKSTHNFITFVKVVDALKTSGFRHDSGNFAIEFPQQLDWLNECGLMKYFEAQVRQPLERMKLVPASSGFCGEGLLTFLDFWKTCCQHLWDSAIITLEDQKYWSLISLQQRYTDRYFPEPNRYHHIFVDEFQDINPLDLMLIKEIARVNKATLTIVGDDDQAIFEWRGAVPRFILFPEKYFGVAFETHTLETNYRSPANILFHSQKLIANNNERVEKRVEAFSKDQAKISHQEFATHDEATAFVLELARTASESCVPKSLAVLSRKKSQLIPLEIMLVSKKIPFYAKEDLNVLLSDAFEDLRIILEAVAGKSHRNSPNEVVKSFLRCCDKVLTYPMAQNYRKPLYSFLLSQRPTNFLKCIEVFQAYSGPLRGDVLDYSIPIARVVEAESVSEAIQIIEEAFGGLKQHYGKAEDDIFYKDPPFLYLGEFAKRYGSDFNQFIEDVDEAICSMSYLGDHTGEDGKIDEDLDCPVHLMTALRAKGKEFESVVILDANDGMWPIRFAETEAELEQERRVFYVAVTRAKKSLYFLSVAELARKPIPVTPYLEEMGLFFDYEGSE